MGDTGDPAEVGKYQIGPLQCLEQEWHCYLWHWAKMARDTLHLDALKFMS